MTWRAGGDGGFPVIGYTVALDDGTTAYVPATTDTALLTAAGRAKAHTATVTALTLAGTSRRRHGRPKAAAATSDASDPAYVPSPFPDDTLNAAYPSDELADDRRRQRLLRRPAQRLRRPAHRHPRRQHQGAERHSAHRGERQDRRGINNAATQKEVDRAEVDATHSPTVTMADGLGSRLGPIYRTR